MSLAKFEEGGENDSDNSRKNFWSVIITLYYGYQLFTVNTLSNQAKSKCRT
jgi:hypothetical protein